MATSKGLLSCSICGGDLESSGNSGAILRTKCQDCGTSSDSMISAYGFCFDAENIPKQSREIQVYYKGKAPVIAQ